MQFHRLYTTDDLVSGIAKSGGWSLAVEPIRRRGTVAALVSRRGFLAGCTSNAAMLGFSPASAADPNAMPRNHGVYEVESYNYAGRSRVHPDEAKSGNFRCFITWGQSQGTNVAPTPGAVLHPNQHFNISLDNGAIYRAADPLLSAPGNGGSIWLKLGDAMIAAGYVERPIWLPLNIGSTPIGAWTPGGVCAYRIRAACSRVRALGIPPERTTILSMTGESDALFGTPQAVVQMGYSQIRAAFDAYGFSASPMHVPQESWINGAPNTDVRNAQLAIVNGTTIKGGPDFDTLDNSYRGSGTDFNAAGVAAAAALWSTYFGL
jgi:hypothetical protein